MLLRKRRFSPNANADANAARRFAHADEASQNLERRKSSCWSGGYALLLVVRRGSVQGIGQTIYGEISPCTQWNMVENDVLTSPSENAQKYTPIPMK